MKYKILALLSLALAGNAYANNHFYVGVDAGAANLMDKESHSVSPESHQLSNISPVLGAYLGYDHDINQHFRLGLEAFFDVDWMQTKIQHAPNSYTMEQLTNCGLRLLPTYMFTANSAGHFILGYVNGQFKIHDSGVYGLVNKTYNSSGVQTGLGLDTALKNNFFVRVDALYNWYGSDTKQGTMQSYTNRFNQLAGELSVYYNFT